MLKEKFTVELKNNNGLLKCSPKIFSMIREKFSVQNPSFKMRRFQPRKYMITPMGMFETGLWEEIEHYISSLNIPVEIALTADFKKAFKPGLPNASLQKIDNFNYYDYQEATIKEFIQHGRGIGILATGAGKSLIIAGLSKSVLQTKPNHRILVIVPNTSLLYQLRHSLLHEYGISSVELWGDGNIPTYKENILIANSQILVSDVKETLKKIKNYDYVIVDEVHKLGEKTNKINKVVYNMPTFNKFGLTGTLPDNMLAAWNVIGKIGPILIEENSYRIREKGAIAPIDIKIILCQHSNKPRFPQITNEPTEQYVQETEYLFRLPERNNIISKLAHKVGGNVLILVERLEHGILLETLAKNTPGKDVYFIQGDMPPEKRKEITDLMEIQDNIICIAMSQIFSTGISIKNLPYVIFTSIGKSNVKIGQSIGRSVRLHANKKKATIFDIADNFPYSYNHLKKRMQEYKDEKMDYTIKKILC